jgi:predicted transcriptional regulator
MSKSTPRISLGSTDLVSKLVTAYVSNNSVPAPDLPSLIRSIHASVVELTSGARSAQIPVEQVEKPTAAKIRKSVGSDGIVSFIDGRPYKVLKRHLTTHGLDPRRYRERFGLPADYPMVAPSYAARRSEIAKEIGLGTPGAMAEVGFKRRTAAP